MCNSSSFFFDEMICKQLPNVSYATETEKPWFRYFTVKHLCDPDCKVCVFCQINEKGKCLLSFGLLPILFLLCMHEDISLISGHHI